jgi:excisionase family DNA binding protein
MLKYYTPEEVAEIFKVPVSIMLDLIKEQKLSAIRIGDVIRIGETELEEFASRSAFADDQHTDGKEHEQPIGRSDNGPKPEDRPRLCWSVGGRKQFRVRGSVVNGADIWPGQMRYPIKFPKEFMSELLSHFQNQEVRIGGKFDDPGSGSLGNFIQKKLKIKMNPAVYLAGLLINERYAERTRRGYIRFRAASKPPR